MRYNTVLFDADGTLLDFEKSEDEALRETMREAGIEPDAHKVATYSKINDGLWKMLERGEIEKSVLKYKRFAVFAAHIGASVDAKAISEAYIKALATKSFLIDGSEDFCRALYNAGKTLYIITNGDEYVQHGRFDPSPLKKYFKAAFISGEIGYEKPSLQYFEAVHKMAGEFDKESAIVIGDSLTSDILGGINFGVDTCWYNPSGKPVPQDMPLTYVVGNFDEIAEILLK